jgi:subtilisin-like proprotein convertase family protein
MQQPDHPWRNACAVFLTMLSVTVNAAFALEQRPKTSRFDALVVPAHDASLDGTTVQVADAGQGFRAAHGPSWSMYLDRRSGAPLYAFGQGIPWAVGRGATLESIAASLLPFIEGNRALLLADKAELVLDREASGLLSPDTWQIAFGRRIAGIPVDGQQYVFTVGHGNLISFGATRWSRIDVNPFPDLDASEARAIVSTYMGLKAADRVRLLDKGSLRLIAARATADVESALVWRVVLRVDGEPGTWEARIDAHTGAIRSFEDTNLYARARGGVYPLSNDQIPPDGVEGAGFPMPFTNIVSGTNQTSSTMGAFSCNGATATTTLAGPYVKIIDTCGPISESVACDADLDLSQSAGTDCEVPPGKSAGNTHASRSGFYHLNRVAEHARSWLPGNAWLTQQLTAKVNLNQTCNAYWDHASVNFFKSGDGCANTGELAGVSIHEWGHGLDENDGGGIDNPTEAYADVTALMSTHVSCIGRGLLPLDCAGYGDPCLGCTGVRDQDWAAHESHTPATPGGFVATLCISGSGPCGREGHCEAQVGGETLWDLAVRDLPAMGIDPASSWQIADKLWYRSRLGSGGNAYNCTLPSSDGCGVTSWFEKLRAVDDDDGNLANGTPHAAALFAAFDRHKIACGLASDASNQNSTICPPIGTAALTATPGAASAQLSWTGVAGASSYNVLRNETSCAASSTIIANVPGTTFTDPGLANGFAEYYRVQAVGTSAACEGRLSNCQAVTPQPSAGLVGLGAGTYGCSGVIGVSVVDANVGSATTTVKITSSSEPAGETITLTRVSPGSASYVGTITATPGAAAADGLISLVNGDTITATYIDADDGQGGVNIARHTAALADCVVPIISSVAYANVTGSSAQVTWTTNEAATSVVHYGLTAPPPSTAVHSLQGIGHAVDLAGLAECSTYLFSVESADAAGNVALDNAAGSYYALTTIKNTEPDFPSTDTPVAIPDNLPSGATSTINVTDNKTVSGVKVTLNLVHTFDGDLVITLTPPVGAPITLSNRRSPFGGANFIATVFDDAAATSIAAGTPPFTGSFRPETPLASANGINAAGSWRLHVVDAESADVGAIDHWTLSLDYPAADCGPSAVYQAHAPVADSCATGGVGAGNTRWDPGEQVKFKVVVNNDGTTPLTGVAATVTSTTPGVVMLDGAASYPVLPKGAIADSLAPHLTAYLPTNLACGSSVGFQVIITSNEGSWSGSFSHGVGSVVSGGGTALNETFAGGVPATWTVVDGGVGGNPGATTWTAANPGARSIAPPMAAPVAIVDSDRAGSASGITQDETLITPVMNLAAAIAVTLQFDQYFNWFAGNLSEIADVDVRSAATNGQWVNVLRQQGASSSNPDHRVIDITAQAAGASNVLVRFHYSNAHYEWWWQIDNVRVDITTPPTCTQSVCTAGPGVAKPVADGSYGTAMNASRDTPSGSTINLTWDVATCSSTDHHVLYGALGSVASSTVSGAFCNLGTTGSASWAGVPAGNLWFVVVGDNDAASEGSWGTKTVGERGGTSASGMCGMTTRDNSGTCP